MKTLPLLLAAATALPFTAFAVNKANNTDALNLASAWAGGVAPTGDVTGTAGVAQFDTSVFGTTAKTFDLGGDVTWGSIRVDRSSPTAGSRITIAGDHVITLNGNNSGGRVDAILLNSGTGSPLQIDSDIKLGAAAGSTVYFTNSRGLTLNGAVDLAGVNLNAFTASGSTAVYNGALSNSTGNSNLTKTGNGTLNLTAANTYTGSTTVTEGTLALTGAGSINNTTSVTVQNATLATYSVNAVGGAGSVINLGNGNSQGTLNYTGAGETTDRVINFSGTGGGATINANGTGAIRFTADTTTTGSGAKGVFFGGAGAGILDGAITSNGELLNLTKNDAGSWTLNGDLALGAGNITVNRGTLTLGGNNSGTGWTVVNGGRLDVTGSHHGNVTVKNGAVLGGAGETRGLVTFEGGSTLALGDLSGAQVIAFNGGVNFTGATSLLIDGALTPGQTITLFTYGGTLGNLSNLTYSGRNTLADTGTAVTLTFGGVTADSTWTAASGEWNTTATNWSNTVDNKYANGDRVTFNDAGQDAVITLNQAVSPGSLEFNNTEHAYTVSGTGAIAGDTGLVKNGAGTLTLATANTYAGGTTLNGGTLAINSASSLGATSGALTFGGAATLETTGSFSSARNLVLNGDATVLTATGTYTNNGVISGNGSLTKSGTGTLVVADANTFTGGTVVNAGELQVYSGTGAGAKSGLGTGAITVNQGASLRFRTGGTSNVQTHANAIHLNGGNLIADDGYATFTGAITHEGDSTLTVRWNDKKAFFNNTITGTGNITKADAGELTLRAAGNTMGSLTVAQGRITLADNATLDISGAYYSSAASGKGALTVNTGATLSSASLTSNWGTDMTINGTLNTGAFVLSGGTSTINGSGVINATGLTNRNYGTSNLNGATFVLGSGGITTDTGTLNLGATTFGASADWSSRAALRLTDAAAGTTFRNATHAITLSGVLSGAGKLVKDGAGSLTLRGANTYAGGTVINGGTVVTGHTGALGAGRVNVTSGTLQIGDGTTNNVTLGAGADLILASGATLAFGSADSFVTLAGDGTYIFGDITLDLGNHFDAAGSYTLITGGDVTSGIQGNVSFANFDSNRFGVAFHGGELIVSAIPEPSTYGLMGAGALGAIALVRRRRKAAKQSV